MPKTQTVFLIDDDIDDQEIFSLALSRADESAQCVCAIDGINALEKINSDEEFKPDFIFIDMNMPRMNGTQCLAEIKKIPRLKDVPVFIYSTASDPGSIEVNKKLGAEDFIVKPADITVLIKTLTKIFRRKYASLVTMLVMFALIPQLSFSQKSVSPDTTRQVNNLKKLSVEDLMNIVVTSVSKSPQTLSEVASAIQVVTGNEIERSTASRLPEAIRLASNMQVAQAGSHDWGITARGFNGLPAASTSLSNKLLVLIDGRSVYTPLFGGVFWDVQNVMMKDIDRLELISGPGGTTWGANAVNGVINIISKKASETQGLYASGAYGDFLESQAEVRYGGKIDSTLFYRVYGQHFEYGSTSYTDGTDAADSWEMSQGGFRLDYLHSPKNNFTIQGDIYGGVEDDTSKTRVNGQNIMLKWSHEFSDRSGLFFQYYLDRTYRNIEGQGFRDIMVTNDFEFQHNFRINESHKMNWGADLRISQDDINSVLNDWQPPKKQLLLYSFFAQDQIAIVPTKLEFTIGLKLLNNNYTELEFHPTARLAYTPNSKNTIWTSVSQAVRTPTRFDVDNHAPILGSFGEFKSEKLTAYEAGYHTRPFERLSISISTFYNDYTQLRSIDTNVTPPPLFYFANHLEAQTYGFEFSLNYDLTYWWKVRGGYTYLHEEFTNTDPHTYPYTYQFEAIDPNQWLLLQSMMNIGPNLQLDAILRYVGTTPASLSIPEVDAYFTFNLRVSYQYKWITLSVFGKNLAEEKHIESGTREIPRSFLGKISLSF